MSFASVTTSETFFLDPPPQRTCSLFQYTMNKEETREEKIIFLLKWLIESAYFLALC